MKFLAIILLAFLSGCSSQSTRPYPKLVQKIYVPEKGGMVEHIQPRSREEHHQYMVASANLMRRYCNGPFKVISETGYSDVTGYSTSGIGLPIGNSSMVSSETENITEDKVRIKFTCKQNESNEQSTADDGLNLQ